MHVKDGICGAMKMPQPSRDRERSYSGDYMAQGKSAEDVVKKWLCDSADVSSVNDVSDQRHYQEREIDFIITMRDGREITAEIKSDAHIGSTRNVVFELLRVNHTLNNEKAFVIGWSARSEAAHVFYVSVTENKIFSFSMADLRSAACASFSGKAPKVLTIPTDNIKSTIVLLIPLSSIKHKEHEIKNDL